MNLTQLDIKQIKYFQQKLGITDSYQEEYPLTPYSEANNLVKLYSDLVPKALYITPEALKAFTEMKEAALKDQIELQVYSAFRSYQYQFDLIKARIDRGEDIGSILTMLAAPGFSEHHTLSLIHI